MHEIKMLRVARGVPDEKTSRCTSSPGPSVIRALARYRGEATTDIDYARAFMLVRELM